MVRDVNRVVVAGRHPVQRVPIRPQKKHYTLTEADIDQVVADRHPQRSEEWIEFWDSCRV